MTERLVVIGGDAAGMSAASQARRRRPADDLEIIAFERSSWVSYSACGEPYHVAGWVDPIDVLVVRTPEEFAERDIEVRLRTEVVALDLDGREIEVRELDSDRTRSVGFDLAMIATGARPIRPAIAGIDLPGVHELRTLDDARALRAVAEEGAGSAVIIGGGYIGLEAAEALREQGWAVTVLTSGRAVLDAALDPDLALRVVGAMDEMGIRVVTGTRVGCVNGTDHVVSVGCDDETHPADLVVLGLGSTPEVDLAAGAGIDVGPTGGIAVDDRQHTSAPGVWAAGDCAEAMHRITGRPANYHLGTIANKTGRVAGINIGGETAVFPGVLGTAITRICGTEVASSGLRLSEAEDAGLDAVEATVHGTTAAGYWPESADMSIRAVAERDTGRILGGQVIGGSGAAKRIDVLATAMWAEMTAGELAWADLAYAPPFSGVWDLVHIAAREVAVAAAG